MTTKQEYLLSNFDIDFSLDKKQLINQRDKLNNFLEKKRLLKLDLKSYSKKNQALQTRILKLQKYVNDSFRNKEIEDKLIEEYLMLNEDEDIIGISYLVDKETKSYINNINFSNVEKNNLLNLMSFYDKDLEILKIVKISFCSEISNYDCAIVFVNKNCKLFIDEKNKKSYSLSDMSESNSIRIDGDFYLIRFAPKKMILNNKKIGNSKAKSKSSKKSKSTKKSHSANKSYSTKKNDK